MSGSLWPHGLAHQAPLSMGFSRQEYWSGLPLPSPGDRPQPGIEPTSLMSPALAGTFFSTSTTWETPFYLTYLFKGLISKHSHILRCRELGLLHMSLWGTEFNSWRPILLSIVGFQYKSKTLKHGYINPLCKKTYAAYIMQNARLDEAQAGRHPA